MTEETKPRRALVTWPTIAAAAVAVGLAIGWYVDHSALENRLLSARVHLDKAREKTNKTAADLAGAQAELKLTKQALYDADEVRLEVGQKLQACQARELVTMTRLEKYEPPSKR